MNPTLNTDGLRVSFENPDFTPLTAFDGRHWKINSLTWSLPGGADTAQIHLDEFQVGEGQPGFPLTALAGCPLSIHAPDGSLVWHGWVQTAARTRNGIRSSCSTLKMANCLIAQTPDRSDAADANFERWNISDWAENSESIARFGRKEQLLTLPDLSAQTVSQHLETIVSGETAWPILRVSPAAKGQPDGLTITARGWWQRLDWVLDGRHIAGREMHLEGGKTHLGIGQSLSQTKLAQSWQTAQTDFEAGQFWLRCSAVGSPSDDLLLNLYADQNGLPGTLLAQAGAADRVVHGGWQWLCWTLPQSQAINPATLYWLVLERSGSADEINYYAIQSDDGRGYSGGSLKRWNGSAWISVNHDLRFVCMAQRGRSRLITEILQQTAPFLNGMKVWQERSDVAVRWREIGPTSRETLQDLLVAGSDSNGSYSLFINSQREAEIFDLPRSPFAPVKMRADGELLEADGALLRWDTPLLGREVLVSLPSGTYRLPVNRLRWTPVGGLRMVDDGSIWRSAKK